MKKSMTLMAFFLVLGMVMAQGQSIEQKTAEEIKSLQKIYKFDRKQRAEVRLIVDRANQQIDQLNTVKAQNPRLYIAKRKAVTDGKYASIGQLMNDRQKAIFETRKLARAQTRKDLVQEMKQKGASKKDIEVALSELEYNL